SEGVSRVLLRIADTHNPESLPLVQAEEQDTTSRAVAESGERVVDLGRIDVSRLDLDRVRLHFPLADLVDQALQILKLHDRRSSRPGPRGGRAGAGPWGSRTSPAVAGSCPECRWPRG